MIFITEHETIPKLKIWLGVKNFDKFKLNLEAVTNQHNLLSYYQVMDGQTELVCWDSWEYVDGLLLLKQREDSFVSVPREERWYCMSQEQIENAYSLSEQALIASTKTSYPNYTLIEIGVENKPEGYPTIPAKTIYVQDHIDTYQTIQTIAVRKIV